MSVSFALSSLPEKSCLLFSAADGLLSLRVFCSMALTFSINSPKPYKTQDYIHATSGPIAIVRKPNSNSSFES